MTTTFSGNIRAKVGQYLTISNRLFQVKTLPTSSSAVLIPQRPIVAMATATQGMTIRAGLLSVDSPALSHDPDWFGPWTINFEERV